MKDYPVCTQCRVRKIRCGRERPQCSNCTRLGHKCEWTGQGKKPNQTAMLAHMIVDLSKRVERLERTAPYAESPLPKDDVRFTSMLRNTASKSSIGRGSRSTKPTPCSYQESYDGISDLAIDGQESTRVTPSPTSSPMYATRSYSSEASYSPSTGYQYSDSATQPSLSHDELLRSTSASDSGNSSAFGTPSISTSQRQVLQDAFSVLEQSQGHEALPDDLFGRYFLSQDSSLQHYSNPQFNQADYQRWLEQNSDWDSL